MTDITMLEPVLSLLAAVALAVVAVFLSLRRREWASVPMAILFLVLAAFEVVDHFASWPSFDAPTAMHRRLYLESLLPLVLLIFSYTYKKESSLRQITAVWSVAFGVAALMPALAAWHLPEEFFYAPDLNTESLLFLNSMGYWFYLAITVACLIALVNIESVFSLTRGTERWKAKFEIIGLSAMMTVLIVYYSQAILYRTISMDLLLVRSAVLIMGAGMVFYSQVFRGSSGKVAVSRRFIYRSLSLLAVSIYLLVLGLFGEGMKYLSGTLKQNLLILMFIAGGLVLMLVLLSEQLRRKAKVYIGKHFYTNKHDYRTSWIELTDRMSSCRTMDDLQDAVLSAYRSSFGLTGAALYLMDAARGVLRLAAHSSMPQCDPELVLPESIKTSFEEQEREFNPSAQHPLSSTEYAERLRSKGILVQIPLICGRKLEGTVVLGAQLIREQLSDEDYDLMKNIARQTAASIVNYRLMEELSDAREFAAVAKISSFIIHDLKNMTAALSLMAANAEEHIANPEFQHDMIQTVKSSVEKMRRLSDRLRSVPDKDLLHARPVDLLRTCTATVEELMRTRGAVDLSCSGMQVMVLADEDELRKAMTNLIQNALESCKNDGKVETEVRREGQNAIFRVIDNGCGMDQEFIRTMLFRPFRTTKEKGLGIGLYQTRQIIEAHRGRIEVKSEPQRGSTFSVYLPVHASKGRRASVVGAAAGKGNAQ